MPNNDLISREAAKNIVSLMVCAPTIKIAAEYEIDDLPGFNAAPTIHAQWIEEPDRHNHWHCSACGFVAGIVLRFYNYCPNCGAKIGGDNDAEQ